MNTRRRHALILGLDRAIAWLARHWLLAVNLAMGLFIGGTLLPPLLMHLGLEGPAHILYTLYGFNCHQLPERSYFLFGPHGVDTYSKAQVISWGADPNHLRGFIGKARVGFKLGMAERNTAIYSTFFLAGLAYALVRRRLPRLRWPRFLLLILPVALDGGSHLVSEVTRLGFRETNAWLASLIGGKLQQTFYTGTTLGSFNWLMRTLTGALFAVACVWFAYPYLEEGFADIRRQATARPGRAQRRPASQSWPVDPRPAAPVPVVVDSRPSDRATGTGQGSSPSSSPGSGVG
jgi:uncharacterized membrane protein